LADPNFRCTVVLVTEHNDEGAFGLILNRRGEHRVADLWESLTDKPSTTSSLAFDGGPVQPAAVFLLHRRDDLAMGSNAVIPGLYLGSAVELLENLLEGEEALGLTSSDQFRVFCGYAGWGPGQLEGELEGGGWIVQSASTEFIFDTSPDVLWQRTMHREGGIYEFFSFMPPKPELN
jgi:putative transcriptional regulator